MTERPILFSGPMVRAILNGTKTVTRRVVKPQRHPFGRMLTADEVAGEAIGGTCAVLCPYGQPGDQLWVREAWAADAQVNGVAPRELSEGEPILYPADGAIRQTGCAMIKPGKTRPSIHMPRTASRILLEITAVRVERLQEISEEQAIAEGVHRDLRMWFATDEGGPAFTWPQHAFEHLWRKINGAECWDANPWVWVVEFKRVTA